jgi:hypothetical protein
MCFNTAMKSFVVSLCLLLGIALAHSLQASGKKEDKISVSFHLETDATDNPKMIFPQEVNGQQRYFRRVPDIMTKDIISFNPFPSDGGEGYGIVFKLKGNATNRFAALTNANQGRWLVAQVNGRVVDGVMIDKQVSDGFIVVWKGVTLADVAAFDANMPRIGAENDKKKK